MKNRLTNSLLVLALTLIAAVPALAAFDFFGLPRTLLVAQPSTYSYVTATWPVTNAPVDLRPFNGIVKLDIFCSTNGVAQTLTATLEQSDDCTNWVASPKYAIASYQAINYTNTYYGTTNLVGTNVWLLPGTNTTVTAATAGWASSYLYPSEFTNVGSITITTNGVASIGFAVEDCRRYLHLIWGSTGSKTNFAAGAILTGRANYVP